MSPTANPWTSPTVSVCIPTFNYGRFLPRAIESVLAQSFDDFELIVADNASTDATPEILASYEDPRIRSIRHPLNLGLFGNFNACLQLARGRYVKFVCADDWIDPGYLAATVPLLERHPSIGLVGAPSVLVDASGLPIGRIDAGFRSGDVVPSREAIAVQADHYNVIGTPTSVILRTSALLECGGFHERFAPVSDLHTWLLVLARHNAGWAASTRVFQRLHETKTHGYEPGVSDAVFRAWSSLAESRLVDSDVASRARQTEGERFLAGALRSARRDPRAAWAALRVLRENVAGGPFIFRTFMRLPLLIRHQVLRRLAQQRDQMLVYGPSLRLGEPRPRDVV